MRSRDHSFTFMYFFQGIQTATAPRLDKFSDWNIGTYAPSIRRTKIQPNPILRLEYVDCLKAVRHGPNIAAETPPLPIRPRGSVSSRMNNALEKFVAFTPIHNGTLDGLAIWQRPGRGRKDRRGASEAWRTRSKLVPLSFISRGRIVHRWAGLRDWLLNVHPDPAV
jgi:hypothetical protein